MVFKKSDGGSEINTGTEAWNVAVGYTQLKILKHLHLLDRWDTLAQFGTEEMDEDNIYNENQIKKRRIEGLQRFQSTLRQLLGNTLFALTKKDQEIVRGLIDRLNNVDEFMNNTYKVSQDELSHEDEFKIDERVFKKILDIFQDIKDSLNTPLNNSGLIFRQSEEVDLDKIMGGIISGG